MKPTKILFIASIILTLFAGCKKGGGLNIFTIEDDKNLGAQAATEIANNPTEYPLLSRTTYAAKYAYIDTIRNQILNSGVVQYKNDFTWDMNIIKNDSVLNAFCTPGGHIYVYTGLIKYLDNASSLAGVLGHEMAHADRRHSTQQLTAVYGISTLLSIALGQNYAQLQQMVTSLSSLQFSKEHEKEADAYSVKYLCPTKYHAEGASYFFQKLEAGGYPCNGLQAFFSTHPCPDNRVTNITTDAGSQNCSPNNNISASEDVTDYNTFKTGL